MERENKGWVLIYFQDALYAQNSGSLWKWSVIRIHKLMLGGNGGSWWIKYRVFSSLGPLSPSEQKVSLYFPLFSGAGKSLVQQFSTSVPLVCYRSLQVCCGILGESHWWVGPLGDASLHLQCSVPCPKNGWSALSISAPPMSLLWEESSWKLLVQLAGGLDYTCSL